MSETRASGKVSVNLDAALREWPEVRKPEGDWDDRAQSVVGRLRRGERGPTSAYVTDEDLLALPLGQSSEDRHNPVAFASSPLPMSSVANKESGTPMTMPADRERDRRSLQDLAKMASDLVAPPAASSMPSGIHRAAEAKKDDSGIVDLAAASQADPGASERARSTPLASQGLFDEEPASTQASAMTVEEARQPTPSVPPIPASVRPASPPMAGAPTAGPAPVRASAPFTRDQNQKTRSGLVTLVVVAIGAAAAGTLLLSRSRTNVDATAAAPTVAVPARTAAAEPAPLVKPDLGPSPVADPPKTDPSLDPNGLAPAPAKVTVAAAPKAIGPKAAPPTKGMTTQDLAPKVEDSPTKMAGSLVPPTPSPAGDLGTAIKKEVGDELPKTPAAAATGGNAPTGNVAQKPSQGAVTGAIGAVLPDARACLGPDDPISRASIVFSSTGSVQSVSVSGAAAGKPAEACIKGALMKAKLQPFAEPTYQANITIRHN